MTGLPFGEGSLVFNDAWTYVSTCKYSSPSLENSSPHLHRLTATYILIVTDLWSETTKRLRERFKNNHLIRNHTESEARGP